MTGGARRAAGAVILLFAGLLVPVAVLAVWADRTVTDTEAFVGRVAPTVGTPPVRELLVTRATAQVGDGLAAALVGEVVRAVVERPAFTGVVERSLAVGHDELTSALEAGSGTARLTVEDGTVQLPLAPLGDAVRAELEAQGVPGGLVPELRATVPLVSVERFDRARDAYRWLDALGWLAPVLVVVATVVGALLRREVAGALLRVGVVGALGCAALALLAGRVPRLLAGAVADPLGADAAEVVVAALTAPLVTAAWWVAAGGAAVAAFAAVLGRRRPVGAGVAVSRA